MTRTLVLSVLSLAMIYFIARSCGLTPGQLEERALLAELNAAEGAAFRQENGTRPGVVTLPDGLQVEVLREGDGEVPEASDWVTVHYRGWRLDGREFDNSYRRGEPATLPIERAIPAWRAALLAAPVGSRLRLVAPPGLAYGRSGAGIIGPEETLLFEIELLDIVVPDEPESPAEWEKPVPNLR